MRGIYRWTKGSNEDWARVEVRLGVRTDLPKSEYDEQKIEPTFWALQEEESWRESLDYAG